MKNRKNRKRLQVHAVVLTLIILAVGLGLRATGFYVIAEPAYDPNTVPFPYDKTLVKGDLLGTVTQRAGLLGSITGTYYDPDGDPVNVRVISAPTGVVLKPNSLPGTYVLTWTPMTAGIFAVVVGTKDTPPTGTAVEATGTILWQVTPQNQRPGLVACGNIDLRKVAAP